MAGAHQEQLSQALRIYNAAYWAWKDASAADSPAVDLQFRRVKLDLLALLADMCDNGMCATIYDGFPHHADQDCAVVIDVGEYVDTLGLAYVRSGACSHANPDEEHARLLKENAEWLGVELPTPHGISDSKSTGTTSSE